MIKFSWKNKLGIGKLKNWESGWLLIVSSKIPPLHNGVNMGLFLVITICSLARSDLSARVGKTNRKSASKISKTWISHHSSHLYSNYNCTYWSFFMNKVATLLETQNNSFVFVSFLFCFFFFTLELVHNYGYDLSEMRRCFWEDNSPNWHRYN